MVRPACVVAELLQPHQAACDALARMRRLQFACPLGLQAAVLLRQQTRCRPFAVATIGETDELVLQFGMEPPGARAGLFG
jgi:hypothetical protein